VTLVRGKVEEEGGRGEDVEAVLLEDEGEGRAGKGRTKEETWQARRTRERRRME